MKKDFYYHGEHVLIHAQLGVQNPQRIFLGDEGIISTNVSLGVPEDFNNNREYNLRLGYRFFINSGVVIEAQNYVEIGSHVIIGPQSYISDMEHSYTCYYTPISLQNLKTKNLNIVQIRDGSWIGSGAKIVGNVKVGYGAVVGANSVVTKDVPDHVVVVGTPARIIKVCDYRNGQWVDVCAFPQRRDDLLQHRGVFGGYDYRRINKELNAGFNQKDPNRSKNLAACMKLIEKILQAIQMTSARLEENNIAITIPLLDDVVRGIDALDKALLKLRSTNSEQIALHNKQILWVIHHTISAYEKKSLENIIGFYGDLVLLLRALSDCLHEVE